MSCADGNVHELPDHKPHEWIKDEDSEVCLWSGGDNVVHKVSDVVYLCSFPPYMLLTFIHGLDAITRLAKWYCLGMHAF